MAADMDNPASLQAAFNGAHGVFSVQGTDQGLETETKRGIAVADAALATGVNHFIYASVGGAERRSGVPHFDSKWQIEQHVHRIGLPVTIVRPTFFMDNFTKPSMRAVLMALIRSYLPKTKPLQMIAVENIGKWVARAFAEPETFIGKAEEIAGDELTYAEIVAAFKAHGWFSGLPISVPRLVLRKLPDDVLRMFEWFGREGYQADIHSLRAKQPGVLSLNDWLTMQKSMADQASEKENA